MSYLETLTILIVIVTLLPEDVIDCIYTPSAALKGHSSLTALTCALQSEEEDEEEEDDEEEDDDEEELPPANCKLFHELVDLLYVCDARSFPLAAKYFFIIGVPSSVYDVVIFWKPASQSLGFPDASYKEYDVVLP